MHEQLHLKGLNGLRAIAAISVVLSHLRFALPEFSFARSDFDMANYGVTIFFTLSGFLITYLLFKEKKKTEISIKNFYIRRILRIWPLYFFYLAMAVITIYIYRPETLPGALPYYLLFAANIPNIFKNHLPYLAHYWTLGVEEQFYIFWPWIIKKSNNTLKALLIFTVCFFLVKLVCRSVYLKWGIALPLNIIALNRFECMSMGGIAAVLCVQQHALFLKIVTSRFTQAVCWLSLLLMALNLFRITSFVNNDLVALVTIGLIVNLSFNNRPIMNLENRVFDFIGKISYGIYILHPLVIFYFTKILNLFSITPALKLILVYICVLGLTIFFAWLSYELLEKRFLILKEKFGNIKSTDSNFIISI